MPTGLFLGFAWTALTDWTTPQLWQAGAAGARSTGAGAACATCAGAARGAIASVAIT